MNSNNGSAWVTALVCCIAPLLIFAAGFLAATAHYKGWINVKAGVKAGIKIPTMNWRRNRE
jgi:hypothetical protein